jgi:hypothetical protein
MVISVNHQDLEIIKKKLESQKLKIDIIDKLQGFLKESRKIVDLYNDKFIDEIKNIITGIEDDEDMKGGCGLSHCPKKSHFFDLC